MEFLNKQTNQQKPKRCCNELGLQMSHQDPNFDSFGKIHRGGTAGSFGNSTFNISNCPLQWLHHFTSPPPGLKGSAFHVLTNTSYLVYFQGVGGVDNDHPGRCEVILHCGSDLHFSVD